MKYFTGFLVVAIAFVVVTSAEEAGLKQTEPGCRTHCATAPRDVGCQKCCTTGDLGKKYDTGRCSGPVGPQAECTCGKCKAKDGSMTKACKDWATLDG